MVSEKMKTFMAGNSAIRAMFEEGKKMAKIYGKENVYDFSLGNPSVEPPVEVKNAAIKILTETSPNELHGYPSNSGYDLIELTLQKDAINSTAQIITKTTTLLQQVPRRT